MPIRTPGDVEVDLDGPGAPEPGPRGPASGPWGRAAWAAGGLAVGLLIGLLIGKVIGPVIGPAWQPAGAPEPSASTATASVPAAPVRMAFGADALGVFDQVERVGNRLVVHVPAVVVNETSAPLVVRDLRVSGPGAGLTTDDHRSFTGFPLHLPPGEAIGLPFRLTSDCTVAVRPVPRLTLVVAPDDGSAGRPVDVRIPDLGGLWGRTLDPALCRS